MQNEDNEILSYTSQDGRICLQIPLIENAIWLTKSDIALLFQKSRSTIAEQIQAVLSKGKLKSTKVCRNFEQIAPDGTFYQMLYYNLDLVFAVGRNTNSSQMSSFRKWALTTLREYLPIRDRKCIYSSKWDSFEELLDRIREIRISNKPFQQKLRRLFSLSFDYERTFFFAIQTKLIVFVTGRSIANAKRISKSLFKEGEIRYLNQVVILLLDIAEHKAKNNRLITMQEWTELVDQFLQLNQKL